MRERKLNRLSGYDYSATGMYFITICTRERCNLFGEINHGIMELNKIGRIAWKQGNNDRTKMTIPKIIHGYKSSVTRIINRQYNMNFKWQKSYYDRIIRNDDELNRFRRYISKNPENWKICNDDGFDHESGNGDE